MHAVVSLLPKEYEDQVFLLLDELEHHFGLRGVRTTPIPHFTYHLSDTYTENKATQILKDLSELQTPIEVHVDGVETFYSTKPTVFLKVRKNPELIKAHQTLWKNLLPYAKGLNLLYSPPLWRPHITLAYQDLKLENLRQVLRFLREKKIEWKFKVDNFTYIIADDESGALTQRQYSFLGHKD